MRKTLTLIAVAVTLALGGCATFDPNARSIFEGGISITATAPITREQKAAIEASYGLAATAVVTYARLRRCGENELETLTNPCSRWSVVQRLQRVNRTAYAALVRLRGFMAVNDQVSAISAFRALQTALSEYRAVAAVNNVR